MDIKETGFGYRYVGGSVESQPHIQAHLVYADTQSPNKKPKELEFLPMFDKNE